MTDDEPPWYQAFFSQDYLDVYDFRFQPELDRKEAGFAAAALALQRDDSVLDLCCGQGRHAVALAQLGFRVTGLDLSPEYLDLTRRAAEEAGVKVETLQADMRGIPADQPFDAVVNMFSSFGYLESEAEDARVLRAVREALKPGGRLLMDLLNREWVLLNYVQKDWHRGADGTLYLEERDFDPLTSRNHVSFTAIGPDGRQRRLGGHHIRLYTLAELVAMLAGAGLEFETAYGDYDGQAYAIDSGRMVVVARRPR